jgi:3-dehydroquinate synthase
MRYALITDDQVAELYGKDLCNHLHSLDLDVQLFSFPAGESSKTRAAKEKLEDALLSEGYGRDLAGFLASTFCRGVELVLIPTTLLAMVDAAIGGKTGVNTDLGKNMIGSFYSPSKLFILPEFLKTLPQKEWFNGCVEMLKAALVADGEFFHEFSNIPIPKAINRAIEIKRRIVALDPFEKGLRRVLNLGHTIGHALETLSNYEISHGEAVAAGIVLEARLSYEMGILKKESLDLIEARFPPVAHSFDFKAVMDIIRNDKKAADGRPRFVLLQEIGSPLPCEGAYCTEVPLKILKGVLHDAAVCAC